MENDYVSELESALKSIKARVERANFKNFEAACAGTLILEDIKKAFASKPLPYDQRDPNNDSVLLPIQL